MGAERLSERERDRGEAGGRAGTVGWVEGELPDLLGEAKFVEAEDDEDEAEEKGSGSDMTIRAMMGTSCTAKTLLVKNSLDCGTSAIEPIRRTVSTTMAGCGNASSAEMACSVS